MITEKVREPDEVVSTYGVEQTTWKAIRASIGRFGGVETRITGGHANVVMQLPDGTAIHTGKPTGARKATETVVKTGVRGVMDGVRKAGIDPMLFLSVLDGEGCTWYSKPVEVGRWGRFLRETHPELHTPERWLDVRKEYRVWLEDHVALATTKREPKERRSSVSETHPFSTTDVVELAEIESSEYSRAVMRVGSGMGKGNEIFRGLIERGEAIRVTAGKVKRNWFSQTGALEVASWLTEKYEVSERKPVKAKPSPVKLIESEAGQEVESLSSAESLLYLADQFGVEIEWSGFALNVRAMVAKIAMKHKEGNRG